MGHDMQPTTLDPMLDPPLAEPKLQQLPPRDHPMLPSRQLRSHPLPLNGLAQASKVGRNRGIGVEAAGMIEASRTLMKSEPELAELIAEVEGVEVTMAEKGFGTRVELRAGTDSGFAEADLEQLLDRLAEPQKQPFGNA
jgi:hypothetical protein